MGLNITENTINAIQEIVRDAFIANSQLDRIKTCLNADLSYVNSSKYVHNMAHKYSLEIADGMGDLIENYNVSVIYGNLPLQNKNYISAQEAFTDIFEIVLNFENKLNMCAKIAFDNMDIHIYQGILEIIEDHTKYAHQAILWKDKIDQYGEKPSFDVHIEKYTDEEFK